MPTYFLTASLLHVQPCSPRSWFNLGKVVNQSAGELGDRYMDVLCFPLYSVLLAMNVTKIDYFSLDSGC